MQFVISFPSSVSPYKRPFLQSGFRQSTRSFSFRLDSVLLTWLILYSFSSAISFGVFGPGSSVFRTFCL